MLSTLRDYVQQVQQCCITLLVITDHGPDMAMRHITGCVSGHAGLKGGILCGIEANIKNIDCSGPMLAVIDLVVAGFHEPLFAPQDKATNTAAMIAAMASANMNIISYPDNPKLF